MPQLKIKSLATIGETAAEFLTLTDHRIWAFYGSMGAGKTTFIKALCKEMKVIDTVNSPTFAIVNEYRTETEDTVYHFDFYRINKLDEAYDFGYEDYFYSGNVCMVEWPELIEPILPEDTLKITIQANPDGSRSINF